MRRPYEAPRVIETRWIQPDHRLDMERSGIDITMAALAGVSSIDHEAAYDFGLRNGTNLSGLCFRYWEPGVQRFSDRFVRVKPAVRRDGRKYLQPVGERPRIYFVGGIRTEDLADTAKPVFLTEGEKKVLALVRAAREAGISALVIGIGGVWGWRFSPKELQPHGSLGKGKSRAIEDLDLITWASRKVYLIFDSDVLTNWKVEAAETALARELSNRGAEVYIVRLPEAAKWAKLG